jgi:hypothetical protein
MAVSRAIDATVASARPDEPVTRYSDVLSRVVTEVLTAGEGHLKAELAAEVRRIDEWTALERNRCLKAFETLLLAHDLPGTAQELHIDYEDKRYTARLRGGARYGLITLIDLAVPRGNLFARLLRVSGVVENLELQIPKAVGWLRREPRLVPEKLGPLLISGCRFSPRGKSVSVRADGADAGYDFLSLAGQPKLQAFRISPEAPTRAELELNEASLRVVEAFLGKLAGAADAVVPNRRALLAMELDGVPFEEHGQPSLLIQRVVEVSVPIVNEIAARSRSPDELVLRRQLDDGRREERFVRRRELVEIIERLTPEQRQLFDPLGLGTTSDPTAGDDGGEVLSGSAVVEELPDQPADHSRPATVRAGVPPLPFRRPPS